MPGAFSLDIGRRLVISAGWGVVTDGDLLDHARAVKADPRFEPSFAQVADLRGATELKARSAGIWRLASENPFGLGARRAILVGTDVAFGMARMYQLLTDESPDESRVFRRAVDAYAWLGIEDADEIERVIAALISGGSAAGRSM